MDLYQNYQQSGNPDQFQRKAQSIASNIQKISQNVSSMTRMVNQISSSSLDQSTNADLRSQLHKITHYTGQLAKDTNEDLKELNKFNLNSAGISDQRQIKLQREKLTAEFSSVLNSFQTIQRTSAQKEKEILKSNQQHQYNIDPPPGVPKYQPHQQQLLFEDEQVSQEELESIRQREQAIRQLESDILDVNQIFKELATMVHEQGETVDSIEAHVESAQIQVEEGTTQLGRAAHYQTQARKKQLCILITCVSILIFVILVIYYSS